LRQHHNSKLFYNEYSYKFVCYNDIANEFRENRLANVRQVLDILQACWDDNEDLTYTYPWSKRIRSVTNTSFFEAKTLYDTLKKRNDYKLRVQYKQLMIYSKEKTWLKNLSNKISQSTEWWEPKVELFEPGCVYLQNDLGYDFRVTFKGRLNETQANWLLNNSSLVKLGPTFFKNLIDGMYYSDGLYCYVRDTKSLTLFNLVLSDSVRRVDKVVYTDKNA